MNVKNVKGSQVTLFFIQPSNYYLGFQSLLLSLVILCFHGTVTSCDPILVKIEWLLGYFNITYIFCPHGYLVIVIKTFKISFSQG